MVVAEGDIGAFPGQTAIMEVIEAEGTEVSRATWDGRSTPEAFAALAKSQAAEGAPVNFTVLAGGTVVPEGESTEGAADHRNSWRIAYTIPRIRDWIMAQRRDG